MTGLALNRQPVGLCHSTICTRTRYHNICHIVNSYKLAFFCSVTQIVLLICNISAKKCIFHFVFLALYKYVSYFCD